MKTRLIIFFVAVIAVAVFADLTQQTNKPVALRRIDPLAIKMQMAVLKDRDIHEVKALLEQGADINAPIGCGTYSALDGAIDTGNLGMLKFLLAHGAKPQRYELANAAFMGEPQKALEFSRALLAAGVDPNATNRYSTPLTSAAYRGNRDVVALLLAQPGINIDAQDVDGFTALTWAVGHGSLDIVDLLVQAGANPNIKNRFGESATTLAERRGILDRLEPKPK
jgi:hypothetical protein